MARRGRKSKGDKAKRRNRDTRESRRPENVQPTRQLIAHRLALTGDADTACDIAIDVLHALWRQDKRAGREPKRGIDEDQHFAAKVYASTRYRIFGSPDAEIASDVLRRMMRYEGSSRWSAMTGEEKERFEAAVEGFYRDFKHALKSAGRRAESLVFDVAILNVLPTGFIVDRGQPGGPIATLRLGLDALSSFILGGRRRHAARDRLARPKAQEMSSPVS